MREPLSPRGDPPDTVHRHVTTGTATPAPTATFRDLGSNWLWELCDAWYGRERDVNTQTTHFVTDGSTCARKPSPLLAHAQIPHGASTIAWSVAPQRGRAVRAEPRGLAGGLDAKESGCQCYTQRQHDPFHTNTTPCHAAMHIAPPPRLRHHPITNSTASAAPSHAPMAARVADCQPARECN